jgi:hypothetical protein
MVRVRPSNIMATQLRNRESREGRANIWQGSGLGYFREWRLSEVIARSGMLSLNRNCCSIAAVPALS